MVIKNVPLDWWVSKALGLWLWGDKLGLLSKCQIIIKMIDKEKRIKKSAKQIM